ncbi:MAG: hypothetical protein GIW95_01645 [Candidatus Eremiobacteraeota bacterium]|nr:hypothetical protein [Candidatus Eremiobacteraeota bacterium]
MQCEALVAQLIRGRTSGRSLRAIAATLERFGPEALGFAILRDVRIVPLSKRRRYREASSALRRLGVDVDAWPVPPAGLFVVEERTVYLRSTSPMTVAHEFGHALDCALGGGTYRSGYDAAIRTAFSAARHFVTPYAATGLDEYFAEAVRAYVGANDPSSCWPRATRARLRRLDPAMHDIVDGLFANGFAATELKEAS